MEFEYRYQKNSRVRSGANDSQMSFQPDTLREPTYFRGELREHISFREAISALHDVVVSDLRYQPKDRTEYKEWRAQQDEVDMARVLAERAETRQRIDKAYEELQTLNERWRARRNEFYSARQEYFDYLWRKDKDAWYVLDPVITVHPDEIFFECFSQDESSYGRLGVDYEVFHKIDEFACGTTNVDYSQELYEEFQKIRTYKTTALEVDPSGFEVETTLEASFKEVKIDLPDSWVRGFLQVNSAMTLPMVQVELHPMDIHNICFILRGKKAKTSPRAMRYELVPGEPPRIIFEPWERELVCKRSVYAGDEPREIRVWGRRRLMILERLIPQATSFTVHLLGTGMPSFYVADLGLMSFTLGLSGWTRNDWSKSGNFDLMAPRAEVDGATAQKIFDRLKDRWFAEPGRFADLIEMDRATVLGAMSMWAQQGRAMYDLNKDVYRIRELSREPLPMESLRFENEREAQANALVDQGAVHGLGARETPEGTTWLTGQVKEREKQYAVEVEIDEDQRLSDGSCDCSFYIRNRMYKGPCAHMLALRIAHARGVGRSWPDWLLRSSNK